MEINIEKKSNLKQVMDFCWSMLKEYPISIGIMLITTIIYASNAAMVASATKNIIEVLEVANKCDTSTIENTSEALQNFKYAAIIYILVIASLAISYQLGSFIQNIKILPKLYRKITELAFDMILKKNYSYHQNNLSGNLGNKIRDLSLSIPTIFSLTIRSLFHYVVAIISSFYTLFLVDIKYMMILVIWLFIFTPLAFFLMNRIVLWSKKLAESQSYVAGQIINIFLNILLVKLFVGSKKEKIYLNSFLDKNLEIETAYQNRSVFLSIYSEISFVAVQAISLYLLVIDKSKDLVTIGAITLILSLNYYIVDSVIWGLINSFWTNFSANYGRISQALQVIQEEPSIKDHPDAKPLIITKGEIVFDKVHFNYNSKNDNLKEIFTNKSVVIPGGQSIGLVGFSGSGKSSFVNLILRFFEIDKGAILIDGQNIQDVMQESLHNNIGVIPQNPTLFNRSIMENIRYGRDNASDEEVIKAAKKACIHDLIISLPEQYDTIIDEYSSMVSGGQKQRIAIARVILKNAPILIMDEATAALDRITEHEIQELLKEFIINKTTLIIAHRMSTLANVDRILVFDKGKIVEDGNAQELLALNGIYAKLCNI